MPGLKTNEVPGTRAVLRHYRMSAYKARQVLDLVRGQDVDRAEEILRATPREGARVVAKVLASAVANARNNDLLDPEELYVAACYADEGTTLKRWRPRARGRATRIRKRTCHITVIVSRLPEDRLERRRARQTAASTAMRSRRVAASRRGRAETPAAGSTTGARERPSVEADDLDEADHDVEDIDAEDVDLDTEDLDAEDLETEQDAEAGDLAEGDVEEGDVEAGDLAERDVEARAIEAEEIEAEPTEEAEGDVTPTVGDSAVSEPDLEAEAVESEEAAPEVQEPKRARSRLPRRRGKKLADDGGDTGEKD